MLHNKLSSACHPAHAVSQGKRRHKCNLATIIQVEGMCPPRRLGRQPKMRLTSQTPTGAPAQACGALMHRFSRPDSILTAGNIASSCRADLQLLALSPYVGTKANTAGDRSDLTNKLANQANYAAPRELLAQQTQG